MPSPECVAIALVLTRTADDASLSAIQAFNQSFPGTPADAHTNEWGKRPAGEDHAGDGDAAASKRQHLDDVNEHADLFLATAAASFGDHAHTINEHNMGDAPQPMDQDDDPDYQDEDEDEDGADEEEIAEETAVVVAATAGAYLQPPAVNLLDPSTFIFWDATQTLRIQSLPILDNLVGGLPRCWTILTNAVDSDFTDTGQGPVSRNAKHRHAA